MLLLLLLLLLLLFLLLPTTVQCATDMIQLSMDDDG
jgi:hypothetical protein